MSSWTADYLMIYSTDHEEGGLYMWECVGDPSIASNWTERPGNPFYNPTTIGDSVETPRARFINGDWYVTTHQKDVPGSIGLQSQATTMSFGAGEQGLLNLQPLLGNPILEKDPAFPNGNLGNGHTGYFEWDVNPFSGVNYAYIGYSIYDGGVNSQSAVWGTDTLVEPDGVTATKWDLLAIVPKRFEGGRQISMPRDLSLNCGDYVIVRGSVENPPILADDGNLYLVKVDQNDGWTYTSTLETLLVNGSAGSFDASNIVTASSIEYDGRTIMFYGAKGPSGENSIGAAELTKVCK